MAAKLHFKYGAMNSGKSTVLLMIAYDYEQTQGKRVLLAKPKTDTKGNDSIVSRLGGNTFTRPIDKYITPDEDFKQYIEGLEARPEVILIDESQFLSKENVKHLVEIVTELNIPVLAFGLRSDFMGQPFEGSSWLFALAQDVEEIGVRSICHCGSRASMNLRLKNGRPVFHGDQVGIDGDGEITYETRCLRDFMKLKRNAERSLRL